jgi:hypothetical protein
VGGEALNIILDMGTGISASCGFVYLYRRCLLERFGYLAKRVKCFNVRDDKNVL